MRDRDVLAGTADGEAFGADVAAPAFPMLPEDLKDPIVAPVFAQLKERWGKVLHIYRVLGWSPRLVRAWAAFAWALRFDLESPRRLRELLVIRIADLLGATYEYQHHLHMALDEGVTTAQVDQLDGWRTSNLFNEQERAVLALADDLALKPGATAETMARLRELFCERDSVELLVTGSYYCGVARIINSAGIALEVNHSDLRARGDH